MVERSLPRAETRRMPDGAFEVGARLADGLLEGPAEGEVGRDRRGERAAGPVGMHRRDARPAQLELRMRQAHDVDRIVTRRVSPLDDYDARAHLADPARRRQ